jgi:hypothetical protein
MTMKPGRMRKLPPWVRMEMLEGMVEQLQGIIPQETPEVRHLLVQALPHLEAALANHRVRWEAGTPAPRKGRYRSNPELVIFNPAMRPARGRGSRSLEHGAHGLLSEEAHELRYRHVEDGKLYRHPFETPVEVRAIRGSGGVHDILLTSPQGLNLWEDF